MRNKKKSIFIISILIQDEGGGGEEEEEERNHCILKPPSNAGKPLCRDSSLKNYQHANPYPSLHFIAHFLNLNHFPLICILFLFRKNFLRFIRKIPVQVPAIETCFMSIDEIAQIFSKCQSPYIGGGIGIFLCPKNMKEL